MSCLKEDGHTKKISSIRVILIAAWIVFIYLLTLFSIAFFIEIRSEEINYSGLVLLFTAMVAEVGVVLLAKVIQKKFER